MKFAKYITLAALLPVAALFVACSSSDEDSGKSKKDDGKVVVGISTDIITKSTVKTLFADGDKMNIFVKKYNSPDADQFAPNAVATYNGGVWSTSPEIRLAKGQHAFIYAVAPYDAAYTKAEAIPIDIAKQVDLLYSGAAVPVSFNTNVAKLKMNHALALVSFNITAEGYSGAGLLSSVALNGDQVFSKGSLNIATGKITTAKGSPVYTHQVNKTIVAGGWTTDLPQVWAIPFTNKSNAAQLTATIDGKTYVIDFPEVEMKSGFQYIFRLTLTDIGLQFVPNLTETRSLNIAEDQMGELKNHGIVTFGLTSAKWTLPYFTGDNVFGSVSWNGGSVSYHAFAEINTSTANQMVAVETWNSTGFELESIENVSTIDISEYTSE